MAIEAKITPAGQSVAKGVQQTVGNMVSVQPGSNIALAVRPDQIANYTRQGEDLIVQMKNGETLRIAHFFSNPELPSHLYLVDGEQQLVSADLGTAVASDGSLTAAYVPQALPADFAGAAGGAGAAGVGAGAAVAAGHGIGLLGILGGVAAAGGIAAAASSGGGNKDNNGGDTTNPPRADTTAPVAASNLAISADGKTLTGNAEAGASVAIDTNGDGKADVTVTAGSNGTFSATLNPPLTNGEKLTVIVTDPAGNHSPAANVTAPDTTPPASASDLAISADGTTLTGHAEAGATVGIDTNGDGVPDQTVKAGADGTFTVTLDPPLTNGQTVSVIVTDPAGNHSPATTVTAPDLVPTPGAPAIDPSNGTAVHGTAAIGSTVTLTDGNGNVLGHATTDAGGHWSFTPASPLPDGTVITAVATNSEGDSGPAASITVDAVAPLAPAIAPTNGSEIHGTAEAGATITLTDGNGNAIGQTTADASGHWSFTPGTPLPDGTVVNAVATDAAGNASLPVNTTVDAVAPAAPTLDVSNGHAFQGIAEAGSTVILTDGNGNTIGQATADGSGHWSFTPASAVADGTVVTAVARDAAGNTSGPSSITVDAMIPDAPVIDPSNGATIHGTAEAGSTVILTNGNGNAIGQTTADANGHWSFTPPAQLPDGTVIHAVARDAEGNSSPPATATIDGVAPAAPGIDPSNGIGIHGTAEAGSTVILTNGNGNAIGQTTADANGHWSFTPGTPLPDGTVIHATATDAAGNVSAQASSTIDATPPAAPTIDPSKGTMIQGTAEAGATVLLTDGNGNAIGQATADGTGHWHFTPSTPLPDGTVIHAAARDAAGNTGAPASATVDAVAPAAPVIDPTNGTVVHGTAEPNSTVILLDGNGAVIGQATAGSNGVWSFTPGSALPNGTVIHAVAQDAAGNTSGQSTATVDATPPGTPVVAITNGHEFHGTAEAGAVIKLTDGSGNPIGQTTADGTGHWSFTPAAPIGDGTVIHVTATDAAGNVSPQGTTTVDASPPPAPAIDPTNGDFISGTAEAGSTVLVTDGNGNTIGQTTADANGHWSVTPGAPLPNGTVVHATATDAAGNVGPQGSATVDTSVPDAPMIDPTNGSDIHGTAAAGLTILLTDGNGVPIGTATTDGTGHWSVTPGSPLPDGTVIHAVAQDGDGRTSATASAIVDAVAPPAPTIDPTNGTAFHGTAEAGATVTLTDGDGNTIGTATADGTGHWSFTPASPLPNTAVIDATATDAAGNTGPAASTTVDAVAPAAPVLAPTNGTTIHGTAEAGSTVTLTDGSGNLIGTATADGDGNWSFAPASRLGDGTVIHAAATDAAGNHGVSSSVTVDAVAPAAPAVDPTNGQTIHGTAEAGTTITLTDGSGNTIGTTTADGTGHWSFIPASPLANGTVVHATATDVAGNASPSADATVDSVAPGAPVIAATNGTEISGTAEAGSIVVLTDGNGNPIAQVSVDGTGHWSFTPGTPFADGTVINATATDPAGNTSGTGTATVDRVPPAAPVIDPTNGTTIHGTAEAGSVVTVTDGDGNTIGTATADGDGHWSITPATPPANGTTVTATATDAAGNTGAPGSIGVDGVAPAAPVIDPTNGSGIHGTAEAGSTVTLTDDSGNPIGTATADGTGHWTFTPASALPGGTVVHATATDAAGNVSQPSSATVDATPPPMPHIEFANAHEAHGDAEPGSIVRLTDDDGHPLGQTVADQDGHWSMLFASPMADGAVIHAIAVDPAGNPSAPADGTVDALPPPPPVIATSNGTEIHGTAEAGAVVTIANGPNIIGQAVADGDGNWSITTSPALPNGAVITATAQDSAGNVSAPGFGAVDSMAPPTPHIDPTNGSSLHGTAEPGSTIVLTDGDGHFIAQAATDPTGHWSITLQNPLPEGTVVNAAAKDAVGNTSAPASTVVDQTPPGAPVIDPTNGTMVHGTAEAGATILLTDAGGNPIGQTVVGADGHWSFTFPAALPNGSVVNAVAFDPAGNPSAPASTTVDTVAPAAPFIAPTNGATINGTAEANSTVHIFNGTTFLGDAQTDGTGHWTFTPTSQLANGTVVVARAEDAAGNQSAPTSTTVDSIAPNAPTIAPTNGTEIHGSAEAGAIVTLTDGSGNVIARVSADGSGHWSYSPPSALPDHSTVRATAADAAGNVSPPVSTIVDGSIPQTPFVNATNGLIVTGTGHAGDTIFVTDSNGLSIGGAVVDGTGHWSVLLLLPQLNGAIIHVTAFNGVGTPSQQVDAVVDQIAPPPPIVDPTNGTVIHGTAEAGATVTVLAGFIPIGTTTADANGHWSFTPTSPPGNGVVVTATAQDAAGNGSAPSIPTIVDAIAPGVPIIAPSNGQTLHGTAEAGATITLTDGSNHIIAQVTADGLGNWSYAPTSPLPNGLVVHATATDAVGNVSGVASTTVDSLPPPAPIMTVAPDGSSLTGVTEPNSSVSIVINGDQAHPITVQTDATGHFTVPLSPGLTTGETITAIAVDAAGNVGSQGSVTAPNIVAPTLTIGEASDGYINGSEISNGIQVNVGLPAGSHVGDVVTLHFMGQGGYDVAYNHVVTDGDVSSGQFAMDLTVLPGMNPFPEGAASVTASINAGPSSLPTNFTIDTIPPAAPLLSVAANLLTISSEPNTSITVTLTVAGVTVTDTVTTDNRGLASLNLLTGLGAHFSPADLLTAQVTAVGHDQAGNTGPVAQIGLNSGLELPVTAGGFGLGVSLVPLALGIQGNIQPNGHFKVVIHTPLLDTTIDQQADSNGHFLINLLNILNITTVGGLLNLDLSSASVNIITLDSHGQQSQNYGIALSGSGLSIGLGEISLNGTSGNDVLQAQDGMAEHVIAGAGNDLILHVGTSDRVEAGAGDDTIHIAQTNFTSIDGGTGFDTLVFDSAINLNPATAGTGTMTNIEQIDMGKTANTASTLTLTAAQINAITSETHELRITGASNDTLNLSANVIDTGTSTTISGVSYHVYQTGTAQLLVEDNTVQVHHG